MSNDTLCPILRLLAMAPFPLTTVDVAAVLHEETGPVRAALHSLVGERKVTAEVVAGGRVVYAIDPGFMVSFTANEITTMSLDDLENAIRG